MGSPGPSPEIEPADALEVFSTLDHPSTPLTASEVAEELECTRRTAHRKLEELAENDMLETKKPGAHSRVWWRPTSSRDDEGGAGNGHSPQKELGDFVSAVEDYAFFTLDPDGTVVTWNEGARRIKGYAEEEILGEHFSQFYVEADRDAGVPDRNLTTAAHDGRVEDEGWRLQADGTRFWAHVTITAIRDDDGELQGFTKVTRDMSERHEYELRLQRQRNRTQELLETAPIPIAVLDENGETVSANDRAQEVLGLTEEEIIEGPARADEWTLYDADGDELGPADVPSAHVLETGERVSDVEIAIEDPDGERTWLSINAAPFSDPDGSNERVVMAGEDVTELKERQRELERHTSELETELSEILGRVSDAFYALDDEWRFTHVNEQAAEIMEHSEEELIGESVWDVFPDATEGVYWENLSEAMDEQESVSFEVYEEEPGTWLEFTAYPSDSGLSIYFQDVTERKVREEELTTYETIVETMNDGIYVKDAEGYFTMVNEAYAEMTGYDREELVGSHASLVVDEATIQESREMISGESSGPTMEAVLERPDGELVPAEGTFASLETGDEVGVVRDITERKERERELERYETIVETVDDGVYIVDEDGYFTMVNDAYAEMTGYDREELLGEHVTLVVDETTAETAREREERLLDGGDDGSPYQADLITKGGERFPAEATFGLLPGSNGDTNRVGVVRDVRDRVERERALEASERRYRTLVDNFPDGAVGLFDEDLRYTAFGGQLIRQVEDVDPEDRIGRRIDEVYPPDLVDVVKPRLERALAGETVTFEETLHGRHLRAQALPVGDADDEVIGGMLVVQDVTDRKQRERELERYERIVENVPVGVYRNTPGPDGEFIEVNPAVADIFDADSVAELREYTISDLYTDPDKRAEFSHRLDEEGTVRNVELEQETLDGETIWISVTAIKTEEDGDVYFDGIVQDVTERHENEQELKQYETLVTESRDVSGILESDGTFRHLTPSAAQVLGYDPEELVGENSFEFVHPDDRERVAAEYAEMAEDSDREPTVEYRFEHGDGHWIHLESRGRNLLADPQIEGIVVYSRDVTERVEHERQLEELVKKLEESNERLERFAYVASHDLQEPLRMISNYLQLLERRYRDELDEDAGEFIDYAVDGAERMRDMISDLLAYSRLDTDGEIFEPTDVDDVLADVTDDLQLRIEETDGDVTAGDLPTVEADRNQLEMLLKNLLSNGIKYSGDDPPRIDVRAERSDDEWVFHVEDDGIGMDPERTEEVFDVFNRLHTHEEYPGTGIGLAMCKKIVDRHDGDIWVESEPGEGSTFSFTIPADGPEESDGVTRETNSPLDSEVKQ